MIGCGFHGVFRFRVVKPGKITISALLVLALFTFESSESRIPRAPGLADCAAFAQSGMLCADLAHDGEKPLPLRAEEY
jgi:hypothetical protein